MRRSAACLTAILLAIPALAQRTGIYSTTVAPQTSEHLLEPCRYELSLPQPAAAMRAVFVIFDRGREVFDLYSSPELFRFSGKERIALLLARHCRSQETEDIDVQPEHGIGRALFTALDQLAQLSKHGELTSAKVIVFGFSGGGSLAGRFPGYSPDRVMAAIAYAPGQYDPLGMDTIELPAAAAAVPQLIITNGDDTVNGTRRPFDYFQRHFERGAPWAFAIQNGVPHHGGLANAQPLMLAWIEALLDSTAQAPVVTALAPGRQGAGWWLYLRTEPTATHDEWDNPVLRATDARIEKAGSREPGNYTAAGWMASRKAVGEWLDFVRKPQHPVNYKYP